MKNFHYLLIYLGAFAVLAGIAVFQDVPGYMDAEYYYATGMQIAQGAGLREPFLWNYLDNPEGLPHPSHAYWMPTASFLVAVGSLFHGGESFESVRWLFILLVAAVAPVTGLLALRFGAGTKGALLASALAVFPGFYLAYLSTTDTFGIYMLLGSIWCVLCAAYGAPADGLRNLLIAFALGLISGGMHLSRADGIIWLGVSLCVGLYITFRDRGKLVTPIKHRSIRLPWKLFLIFLATLCGYLLIMGFWIIRNQQVFGSIISPGGRLGLWFIDYDDLYTYPSSVITFDRWIASGLKDILSDRWWAFKLNLQTAFIVQGSIFLWPLALIGAWKLRRRIEILGMIGAWIVTISLMTIVFPFAGARGGFFHSGAAFQPLIWSLVPIGLAEFVRWGANVRGWDARMAYSVFGSGIILITFLFMAFVAYNRVIGKDIQRTAWGSSYRHYADLDAYLDELGIDPGETAMVNNPPGYYLSSGTPAIAIPDGDETMLLAAGRRYNASYVLLEHNHPVGLRDLYSEPDDRPGLDYLSTFQGTHIYRIIYP